jgi:undecaprenyl diphosphate synthase
MLLTLGTGMGCALFNDGVYVPNLELAHHPFRKRRTYEDYVGARALAAVGKRRWNRRVAQVVAQVLPIFNPRRLTWEVERQAPGHRAAARGAPGGERRRAARWNRALERPRRRMTLRVDAPAVLAYGAPLYGAGRGRDPLEMQIRERPVPAHVGIIMDGNGRWAEERACRVWRVTAREQQRPRGDRTARRIGVQALTLYASAQNWSRPADEVAGLMDLLREYLESERQEILENGIRLDAVGELDRLPRFVRAPLEAVREASARNRGMVLTLALSYGGQEEIAAAADALVRRARAGTLPPGPIDVATFSSALWTSRLPPVDLVIRTSGETRVSNFMLWQSAYAEFIFVDTLWPEFRARQFLEAVLEYQHRERRFGLTSAHCPSEREEPKPRRPHPHRAAPLPAVLVLLVLGGQTAALVSGRRRLLAQYQLITQRRLDRRRCWRRSGRR